MRAARGVGWVALFGVLVLVLAPVSAAVHLYAPAARQGLLRVVSDTMSGAVSGRIELRGMHAPTDRELRFDELRVEDPETGASPLRLRDVRIRPSWSESLSSLGLVLQSAQVGGGELAFEVREDGQVALAALLQSPSSTGATPRSKKPGSTSDAAADEDSPGAPILWLRQVRFDGLDMAVVPASGPTVRFTGLSGGSQVRLDRRDSVRVQAWGLVGSLRSASVPLTPIEIEDGKLWVDAGSDVIAEVAATARALGGDFPVTYAHDKARALGCLCVGRRDVGAETRLALGLADLVVEASRASGLRMAVQEGDLGQPTVRCCGG